MAFRIMSAIVQGTHNNVKSDDKNQTIDHDQERLKLQQDLLAAAKQCHIRFGGKSELATESDPCVHQLCYIFERIFYHGLKHVTSEKQNQLTSISALRQVSELVTGNSSKNSESFWPCIRQQLTWHEQERFSVLQKIQTDQGRGRAWLRAALNERSLERHLHSVINPDVIKPYFNDWAFLLDQEKSSMLPNIAAGLTTILFAISIDNEELDSCFDQSLTKSNNFPSEPIITPVLPGPSMASVKARRKVPTHIILFDDDDDDNDDDNEKHRGNLLSTSAPTACLNSSIVPSTTETLSDPTLPIYTSKLQLSTEADEIVLDIKPIAWAERDTFEEERLLTPITDPENMGGLVPVSPSYLEDSEVAEAAIEATEPLVNTQINEDTLDEDSLRVRLLALNEVLEQAREDAITSKLQLARFQRQHQNYLEKHELQIQTLNRENELLRQQLRKYVTAVQMLKKDSDTNNIVPEEDSSLDYHKESQEYQQKLVQVAEMHAELMEFNARLTMQLTNKDKILKLLRAELEYLRGPINEEDLPSEAQCLIHIWIPSAFLTGQPSDVHHVYQIYVRIRDTEWNIYRRYAQFHSLYRDLKKHDVVIGTFEFPPKKTIGNKDTKFVEERRQKLQQWLRRITNRLSHSSPAFFSCPSKQTFISLMPFFGDFPNKEETKRTYSSSPQYMGL